MSDLKIQSSTPQNLSTNLYNYALQQDMGKAKQTYIELLNQAKQNPSINIQDLLNEAKDTYFFKGARQEAMITGSRAPIGTAVKNYSIARANLETLQKDKEITSLAKEVKKAAKQASKALTPEKGIIMFIKQKSSKLGFVFRKLLHK